MRRDATWRCGDAWPPGCHRAVYLALTGAMPLTAQQSECDAACLERIAQQYRAAYLAHDPKLAPFAEQVRYTENNVEMPFPDGSWDTVTEEVGPALTLSDPVTGQRRHVYRDHARTRRRLPRHPPQGGARAGSPRPSISSRPGATSAARRRRSATSTNTSMIPASRDRARGRARGPRQLVAHANGYFDTLQHNNGEIRGTLLSRRMPRATRTA